MFLEMLLACYTYRCKRCRDNNLKLKILTHQLNGSLDKGVHLYQPETIILPLI